MSARGREQSSMTILCPIRSEPGHLEELTGVLGTIGRDVGCRRDNHYLRFADFGQIHFARWTILPADAAVGSSAAQLAFGTDHDGDDLSLLRDLADRALPALDAIYSHCEGWPGPGDARAAVAYLAARRAPYAARHIACRGRTVGDLRRAVDDRRKMQDFVDDVLRPGLGPCPPPGAPSDREAARRTVAQIAEQTGATLPPRRAPINWQLPALVLGALLVLGGITAALPPAARLWALAVVVALVVAYFLALRAHEKADAAAWEPTPPPDLSHLARLRGWEDRLVQNQMTHLVPVKPGWLRRATLRFVFEAVDLLARLYWNRGDLGGIPSIHFARWVLVDGGRRLLFFSNFDGSWENYLGDFIDRASVGLTGVWSNTADFPPTSFLIGTREGDGSRRASEFKNWTRRYQIETQVWYSAYPDLSVVNLLDALALCEGREVAADPPGDNATAWLQRL